MHTSRLALLLVGLILASGCAEVPPRKEPAPVVSGAGKATPQEPRKAAPSPSAAPQAGAAKTGSPVPGIDPRPPRATQPPQPNLQPMTLRPPRQIPGMELRPVEERPEPELPTTIPVEETLGIGTRTVTDDPNTTIRRYESTAPSAPAPAHSRAVTTLVAIAEREKTAGNFDGAAAQVERAIDLEPRNADLWHRLARLRMAQGKLENAELAARRSNELAGGNLPLQRNNWRLISEIKFELGEISAGEEAAQRAEELY